MTGGGDHSSDTKAFYDGALRDALERVTGEHLHLGLFSAADQPHGEAAALATRTMADPPVALSADSRVLEVACGVGAAARHLAERFGCHVTATNISERQLEIGREMTVAAGLSDRVAFEPADFQDLSYSDAAFDLWWCQESLLHADDKVRVLREARRVLKPGGQMVLSDVTVPAWVDAADRARIYERVQSPGMWAAEDYQRALEDLGVTVLAHHDWSHHVAASYDAIRRNFEAHQEQILASVPEGEFTHQLGLLRTWVAMAGEGKIGWVYFLART